MERNRERGEGAAYDWISRTRKNGTIPVNFSFRYPRTKSNQAPPAVTGGLVTILDQPIQLPLPTKWIIAGSARYYSLQLDSGWWSAVEALLKSAIPFDYLRIQNNSGLESLDNVEYETMSDIVGSGFVPGKVFVINPCHSTAETFQGGKTIVGEDKAVFTPLPPLTGGGSYQTTCSGSASLTYEAAGEIGTPPTVYAAILEKFPKWSTDEFEYLYSDAHSDIQEGAIDLLTTLAEMQGSIDTVTSNFARIGKIIRSVKRRDFSFLGKKISANDAADAWLEARYAVRPLMYDVKNALAAMSSDGVLKDIRKAYRRETDDQSNEETFSLYHDGINYDVEVTIESSLNARAGSFGKLQVDIPWADNLGVTNIATTAWELVPWSFVVGWFVNTAGIISSLNPNPIYRPKPGFISVSVEHIYSGNISSTVDGEQYTIPISGTYKAYRRIRKTSPDLLNFNVNLSVPKLVDLLAFTRR